MGSTHARGGRRLAALVDLRKFKAVSRFACPSTPEAAPASERGCIPTASERAVRNRLCSYVRAPFPRKIGSFLPGRMTGPPLDGRASELLLSQLFHVASILGSRCCLLVLDEVSETDERHLDVAIFAPDNVGARFIVSDTVDLVN